MTARPNQHWGGKNHTSVSRFVTRMQVHVTNILHTSRTRMSNFVLLFSDPTCILTLKTLTLNMLV